MFFTIIIRTAVQFFAKVEKIYGLFYQNALNRLIFILRYDIIFKQLNCRCGEIGRRAGLKIPW